jgi:tetratricopeptide (TPR) repeat protein
VAYYCLTWSKRAVLILTYCLCVVCTQAQELFWTSEAERAHELISGLRIDEGLSIIRLQSITHPDNYIWPYLEDYAAFLEVFVQEDIRGVKPYLDASSARLARLELVPENNAMALMTQAQINLHHCALRLQQGQFLAAAADINKAFKLLKRNHKLFPTNVANLRLYASLKVAFGAIPDQYRWLVSMVTSLSGSIEEGLRELHHILRTTTPETNVFYHQTVLFAAIAEGRLNNKPQAGLDLLYRYFGKNPEHDITRFLIAGLLIELGNNDGAIRIMTQRMKTPGQVPMPFMDFLLGECKLFRGDADADSYFKNFLVLHKGKHFIKEAHQKLAWYALLKGDRPGYFSHMQQILIKGANMTDEDQQAMLEAESHATPHPLLLRARLYYDGGYYDQATSILEDDLFDGLTQQAHRLEFLYRKGRVLQAKKSHAEALHYFSLTISSGQFERFHFACSAALQSGIIYEMMGSEGAAVKYYNMCLAMIPESYASSLHQKARMGLNRIGE